MTITPAQLEEWKRLAEAATPGEWTQRLANDGTGDRGIKAPSKSNVIAECFADMDYDGERALSGCKANAAFIAASRTALPALIAEVERLRADVRALAACADVQRMPARLLPIALEVAEERFSNRADHGGSPGEAAWERMNEIETRMKRLTPPKDSTNDT